MYRPAENGWLRKYSCIRAADDVPEPKVDFPLLIKTNGSPIGCADALCTRRNILQPISGRFYRDKEFRPRHGGFFFFNFQPSIGRRTTITRIIWIRKIRRGENSPEAAIKIRMRDSRTIQRRSKSGRSLIVGTRVFLSLSASYISPRAIRIHWHRWLVAESVSFN